MSAKLRLQSTGVYIAEVFFAHPFHLGSFFTAVHLKSSQMQLRPMRKNSSVFFVGGNFFLSSTPVWRRLWQPVLGGECTLEFSGGPAADSDWRRYTPYIHFGDLHTSTRFSAHGVRSYLIAVLLDSRQC